MDIHEYQAKQLISKYGVNVPIGEVIYQPHEAITVVSWLNEEEIVVKAQVHAGGRGKAGGIKIVNTIEELNSAAKEMLGKKLITHQTGPQGREVKRLYVESSSEIEKEFYLSCLVDRTSSKIAFISSDQGGMDIEEVAKNNPKKIVTTKINLEDKISDQDCEKIVEICRFQSSQKSALISLEAYIEAMPDGQSDIYYLTSDDMAKAVVSPHLEGFAAKNIDVLLLTDPIDEFWIGMMPDYKDKKFISISKRTSN